MSQVPDAVVQSWDEMIDGTTTFTPFQSYAWLTAWCEAYNEMETSFVLTDRLNGCSGIMCLMNHAAETRSTSYNATDYTGPVTRNDLRFLDELARELVTDNLRRPLRLWNIRPTDPLLDEISKLARLDIVNATPTMAVELRSARYEPPLGSRAITRSQLDRKARRIDRAGGEFRLLFSKHLPNLEEMISIHTKRWKLLGGTGNFADSRRTAFIRRLIKMERFEFLIAQLWIGSDLIAYRFGPTLNGVYYDWNTSFDPDHSPFSPGVVLLQRIVESLKEDGRFTRIDFLRGAESYKEAWANDFGNVIEVRISQR